MKQTLIVLYLILFGFLSSSTGEQLIQLKLEQDREYIYELADVTYVRTKDGKNGPKNEKVKEVKITVLEQPSDTKILIGVKIVKNYVNRPYNRYGLNTDYIYPDFKEQDPVRFDLAIGNQTLISRKEIQFMLDLDNREVEIHNRVQLLEEFHKLLVERNFPEESKNKLINVFNKRSLSATKNLIEHLLWFHNSNILEDGEIQNSLIEDQLRLNEQKGDSFEIKNTDYDKLIPGKWHKKYWLDTEKGILTNCNQIKIDSILNNDGAPAGEFLYRVSEKNYTLLSNKKLVDNALLVTGEIKNSINRKLHFRFMEDPFGSDLKKVTVFMDDNGRFTKRIKFRKKGMVYVTIDYATKTNSSVNYVFYAEPGDTISFKVEDINQWENIKYAGARKNEATLLHQISKQYNIFQDGKVKDFKYNLLALRNPYFLLPSDLPKEELVARIYALLTELKKVQGTIDDTQNSLSKNGFQYIKNETTSYYYNLLFVYLAHLYNVRNYSYEVDAELSSLNQIEKFDEIEKFVNDLDIHEVYNDYGFYSRKSVSTFLIYNYNKLGIYKNPNFVYRNFHINDIDQHIQFARIMIRGGLLYRELAGLIQSTMNRRHIIPFEDEMYHMEVTAVRNLDLLIRLCGDADILRGTKQLMEQYNSIKDSYRIPEIPFVDMDSTKVILNEDFLDKPTVYYFLSPMFGWVGDRYKFDEMAKENPNINFVLIAEGNNFKEWKEYTLRAESVASQLFMSNDSLSIKDLFLKPEVILVANSEGEYFGYGQNLKTALKLAKDSLEPKKKELSKSQLKSIVIVLLVLFVMALIGVLVLRWRTRERLKREQQFRKVKELELTAIRSQMNPHFLFNSLNSVQYLIHENKGKEVDQYLANFAGLIRKVLKNSEKEELSLADELQMTEQYLTLEKLRFEFDYEIISHKEIDLYSTQVPSMLMQPFVENALVHGLQSKSGNRYLKVEISKQERFIKIIIEDNGIGRKAARKIKNGKNGIGTKRMKERLDILQQKYKEKYHLDIIDIEGEKTGTRIEILIPEEV